MSLKKEVKWRTEAPCKSNISQIISHVQHNPEGPTIIPYFAFVTESRSQSTWSKHSSLSWLVSTSEQRHKDMALSCAKCWWNSTFNPIFTLGHFFIEIVLLQMWLQRIIVMKSNLYCTNCTTVKVKRRKHKVNWKLP